MQSIFLRKDKERCVCTGRQTEWYMARHNGVSEDEIMANTDLQLMLCIDDDDAWINWLKMATRHFELVMCEWNNFKNRKQKTSIMRDNINCQWQPKKHILIIVKDARTNQLVYTNWQTAFETMLTSLTRLVTLRLVNNVVPCKSSKIRPNKATNNC